MPDTLEVENHHLRTQLAELIEQARRNEDIMRRHQEFDLNFISASGFRELIDSIFAALTAPSELDIVTLAMLDPRYEIRRILHDLNIDLTEFPNLLFLQDVSELGDLHGLTLPQLDEFEARLHARLFPSQLTQPASIALLPLWRHRAMIGMLALGSLDAQRFTSSMATDFLEHMSSIVAICMENVINIERLKHLGLMDPLTGVSNRRYVEQRLMEEIGRTRRRAGDLCCLYIDIDHFKRINDSLGHPAGDEVLREVAGRIKMELRLSDTLGRYGGEEFVALLPETALDDASNVAERIRAGIADKPFSLAQGAHNATVSVTVSIGVATLDVAASDQVIHASAQQMLTEADTALYQAKHAGRNRVRTVRAGRA
jgi:two-component system cell cycle response regulator